MSYRPGGKTQTAEQVAERILWAVRHPAPEVHTSTLARLGLAYLKIDGSYIRSIDLESDKRLFIEAIQRAAHSIDLPLIAERVETEGELSVIREMGLYGVQGQLFGEPKPWK